MRTIDLFPVRSNGLLDYSKIQKAVKDGTFPLVPEGHAINVCFGAGVDSTAMLILLFRWGIKPDIITFADTGGEKPETYLHLAVMDEWVKSIGFPPITICKLKTCASTPYDDLEGNNTANETLPSLAMGKKGCSVKWKQGPQDSFIKGVNSGYACPDDMPVNKVNWNKPHPLWLESQRTGKKIIKMIGYDAGAADIRRSKNLKKEDKDFMYCYPLQHVGWSRPDCIQAIKNEDLPVPIKSACWFCPASQKWELFWLAGTHPDLFMKALVIEHKAMLGKHSHWPKDVCTYDKNWLEYVSRTHLTWPTVKITVGLGRSFAWNRWARENGIVSPDGRFIANRLECLRKAVELQENGGNAEDKRTTICTA